MSTAAAVFTDPPHAKPPLWTAPLRAASPLAFALVVAAALYLLQSTLNPFYQNQLTNCGIAVVLAVSLTVVNGFTGQFSIGHSGFMSLGGYAAAALVYYGSFKFFGDFNAHGGRLSGGPADGPWVTGGDGLFLLALLFGGCVAGVVGWVVGLPSLRLRGDYLAIVTLGFCEIVRIVLQGTGDQLDNVSSDPLVTDVSFPKQLTHLGGALGFSGAPVYSTVFWIALVTVLTLVLTVRLKYSAYGRAMLAVREDDVAAQAVGVNVTRFKVRAFVFAAFFAGVAGGLFALKDGTINAGELGFQRSFDFVIMVVLGGLGSISGAAVAAVLLTLLPEWLRNPPGLWPWGFALAGVVAVLIAAFAPRKRGPLATLAGVCLGWEALRLIARRAGIDLAQYRLVIYSLLLIVMMIVRPQGLFGIHEAWDYLPVRWQWWRRPARGAA